MPRLFVLDASVAGKWYLNDEDLVDQAEKLLKSFLQNEIELYAPILLKYEPAQLLYKAQRFSRKVKQENCEKAYKHFCSLPIIYHQFNDRIMREILSFAIKFNKSFYDCCYICLANALNCQWITDDREYERRLPAGFPKERILMLKTFK